MVSPKKRHEPGKWIPLSGVIFLVLTAVAAVGLGGSTPSSSDPGAKIPRFETTTRRGNSSALWQLVFVVALAPSARLHPSSRANGAVLGVSCARRPGVRLWGGICGPAGVRRVLSL